MDPQTQSAQPIQTASEQTVQPQKGHPKMLVVIILFIVILLAGLTVIFVLIQPKNNNQVTLTPSPSAAPQPTTAAVSPVSPQEQRRIDVWIGENNLNLYGDSPDTVYAGGTPLFNEATGQTKDRYEYIIEKHPDRPW